MSEIEKITVFHPDMMDMIEEDSKEYFNKHEATKAYREGLPSSDSDDKEIYLYVKDIIFNTFEALWAYFEENENSKEDDTIEQNIHKYFDSLIKLHFIEDDFLNHFELSLILWFYSKNEKEEVSRLQNVLDKKLIPKTDHKNNKLKVSPFSKCLSANLAFHIEELGISKRQAILLSSDFFNLSSSAINDIITDVREANASDYIDMTLPVRDLIKAFIIIQLNERIKYIENIISGYQSEKTNKSRTKHFNEAYDYFLIFIKNINKELLELLNTKELNILTKNIQNLSENELENYPTKLELNDNDELSDILFKTNILAIGWLLKIFSPEPLENIFNK